MISGLEDLHELENEVEDDSLLAVFCTIENYGVILGLDFVNPNRCI
jgi:hypothetical protein